MNGKHMTRYQIIQDRFLTFTAYYPLTMATRGVLHACARTIYKQMMTYKVQNRYDCHLGHVLLNRGVGLTIEFSDRHDKKHRLVYDAVKDELRDEPTTA